LQNPKASVNISPLALQTAVTLTLIGSTGETALQLSSAMKVEHLTKELLTENYKTLISQTTGDSLSGLKIAHKMYLPKKRLVSTEFIKIATEIFDTDIRNINFANTARCVMKINQWVEEKMQKKGEGLIDGATFNQDTCVVIVNVADFDGTWARPFNRYRTSKQPFWLNNTEEVAVNMMNTTERFGFVELNELDAKAIELNYRGSEVSLVIVLPNDKSLESLEKLETTLANFDLSDLVKEMTEQYVNLFLPRFRTGCILKMRDVFTKVCSFFFKFKNLMERN
jgi:serpin B